MRFTDAFGPAVFRSLGLMTFYLGMFTIFFPILVFAVVTGLWLMPVVPIYLVAVFIPGRFWLWWLCSCFLAVCSSECDGRRYFWLFAIRFFVCSCSAWQGGLMQLLLCFVVRYLVAGIDFDGCLYFAKL